MVECQSEKLVVAGSTPALSTMKDIDKIREHLKQSTEKVKRLKANMRYLRRRNSELKKKNNRLRLEVFKLKDEILHNKLRSR